MIVNASHNTCAIVIVITSPYNQLTTVYSAMAIAIGNAIDHANGLYCLQEIASVYIYAQQLIV